jgi:hypothetical protein
VPSLPTAVRNQLAAATFACLAHGATTLAPFPDGAARAL